MARIELGVFEISRQMKEYVAQALNLGRLSYGPLSQEFEQRFAALHGCEYGVLSNSGTSSLLVALQTLKKLYGWELGDEVIVPALTFVASVNVILQVRLKPVLVDIEPNYYCINPALIEQAITRRTRAIMPVHLFGQPADMQTIRAIADSHNLKIVEDSCEAAFAGQADKSISSWGDIGCHSFYMAHIVTTGVGGISLTNNRDYATMLRSLSNHGLSYKHLSASEEFDPMMLSRYFVFDSIGHSFRITELEAALGLAQLNDWQAIKARRQYCHQYFIDNLTGLDGLIRLPKVRPGVSFTPMMFPVADLRQPKQKLMDFLTRCGIGVRDAVPLTNQPVYKGLFREAEYPQAKFMNEHGLYWPCHQGLTNEDLAYIVQSVKEFYATCKS